MAAVDPVTLEVVGNYLVSAVREMGTTLMRTAYSTGVR
jgi:N-methylhydantoinase B/oxoprolinase/acetone carboxylase alpha subunit